MPNWFESIDSVKEYHKHVRMAVILYQDSHKGESFDLIKALQEYAESLNLQRDYFALDMMKTHKRNLFEEAVKNVVCPKCGSSLEIEQIKSCVARRFKVPFTGLIMCSSPDCLYHFYTLENFVRVVNKLREGNLKDVKRLIGVI